MKKTCSVATGVVIVSIIVIGVIVFSLLNIRPPEAPIPTLTTTNTPTLTSTSVPTVTYTPDPCAPGNVQKLALDFNRNAREFDDLSVIAQNTPREQLVPIITQLQTIRRASEDYPTPACITTLKEHQLAYMNVFIDTLLSLYSSLTNTKMTQQDVALINQGMAQAVEYHNQYMIEMARLLGVTPSVATQVPASGTPATPKATETPLSG